MDLESDVDKITFFKLCEFANSFHTRISKFLKRTKREVDKKWRIDGLKSKRDCAKEKVNDDFFHGWSLELEVLEASLEAIHFNEVTGSRFCQFLN